MHLFLPKLKSVFLCAIHAIVTMCSSHCDLNRALVQYIPAVVFCLIIGATVATAARDDRNCQIIVRQEGEYSRSPIRLLVARLYSGTSFSKEENGKLVEEIASGTGFPL